MNPRGILLGIMTLAAVIAAAVVPAGRNATGDTGTAPLHRAAVVPAVSKDGLPGPTATAPPWYEGAVTGALRVIGGFESVSGGNGTALEFRGDPADPSLAVGSDAVVVSTNAAVGLFSKSGERRDARPLWEFFGPVLPGGAGLIDPRTFFDSKSSRYFINAVSAPWGGCRVNLVCPNQWVQAVSKSATPSTLSADDWVFYAFDWSSIGDTPTRFWGDFGFVSADDVKVVFSGNLADESVSPPLPGPTKVWLFDRAPFLSGSPLMGPIQEFSHLWDAENKFELQSHLVPATTEDPVDTVFLVHYGPANCDLEIVGVTGRPGQAQLRINNVPQSGACSDHGGADGLPPPAAQRGGGPGLSTQPHVSSHPVLRDGRLWVARSLRVNYPSGDVVGVKVTEYDVSRWPERPTIVTDSVISTEGTWYFYPALAVDGIGNVALGMNRSSQGEFGSLWVSGRLVGDPPGQFRPPAPAKRGLANIQASVMPPSNPTRVLFADFSGAALDPVDGTAWIVGEYATGRCTWGAWVAHLQWSVVTAIPSYSAPDIEPPPGEPADCGK